MQDRISHHQSIIRMYQRLKKDGMNTIWDRYEAQGLGSGRKMGSGDEETFYTNLDVIELKIISKTDDIIKEDLRSKPQSYSDRFPGIDEDEDDILSSSDDSIPPPPDDDLPF